MIIAKTTFRVVLVSACAIVCAGFIYDEAAAQARRFDGVTLRVATYGGPWKDALQELIGADMEKLGAKIEWDTGAPNQHLAKLIIARDKAVPFDVTEIDDPTLPQYVDAGVLEPFNLDRIANVAGLIDKPSTRFNVVPIWSFQEGVVYNADKFKELGIPKPQRYTDLINPSLTGRVGLFDINGANGPFAVYGFALDTGGSVDNITPGLQAMKKLGAKSFFTSAPTAMASMVSGDTWAMYFGAAWAVRMRKAGNSWASFAHLKVGDNVGVWSRGYIGMVKGAKNAEAAEYYVSRYISPEVQRVLAVKLGSVPVAKAALPDLDKDPLLHEILKLTPQEIANMRRVDFSTIDLPKWVDAWNSIMTK
jgi:putative spermidine/putrescine transport system substrate-binding protein